MQTDNSRGAPSGARLRTGIRGVLVGGGACVCLFAAPATASAANLPELAVPTPIASPGCAPLPCDPLAPQLTLTQTVDRTTAAVGDTVSYTVTLANTGLVPATGVTVDDVMSGDAGYVVDDGTASTTNTFVGQPVTTITRVLIGHYQWGYTLMNPGDTDVVKFSAVVTAPRNPPPAGVQAITLTSTASSAGLPDAVVSTTASFTPPSTPPGGLHGAKTSVPATGSAMPAALGGFLLLGGLGFVLLGAHARRRDERAA